MTIATAPTRVEWRPHVGQQERFLASSAFEALFGGAAGPGKTECLLMEALRQVHHPRYTAILFRRTFPMLEGANGLIQRSLNWYPSQGGVYNASKHYWTFPSGARIYFGHMQSESDRFQYQGSEYAFIGFDELTEFTQAMYLYMFTRCRVASGHGLRAYVRSATNPGNIGHTWVKRRFIERDIVNRSRYFAQHNAEDSTIIDTEVSPDHPDAMSRAYYPARLDDNPSADPNYRARIRATGDRVQIARLEHGDWDAEYTEGLIYDNWSSVDNVSVQAEYNPDLPVYIACDDGYAHGSGRGSESYHPRIILWVQMSSTGGINIFDELAVTGQTHAQTLRLAFGSPDGTPTDTPTRYHAYRKPSVAYMPSEAAMFKGEVHKYGIVTVNSTHKVTEGIKAVRQLIYNADTQERKLLVHPRCEEFIYEAANYRSDPHGKAADGEILPLKQNDHALDAGRYIIYKRSHI